MSYLYAYQCNANELQNNIYPKKQARTREPKMSMGLSIQTSNIIPFRNAEHNSAAGLEVVDCCCMKYVFILPTKRLRVYLITYIHS